VEVEVEEVEGDGRHPMEDADGEDVDTPSNTSSVLWKEAFMKKDGKAYCKLLQKGPNSKPCTFKHEMKPSGPTNPLWQHLNKKHEAVHERLWPLRTQIKKTKPVNPKPPFNQMSMKLFTKPTSPPRLTAAQLERVTFLFFGVIAEANLSFRALPSSQSFRLLMEEFVGWKVPSKMFFSRALPYHYDRCLKALKAELQLVESISITTDSTYLTHKGAPYIAITGHWIDSSWALHDRPLAVFPAQQSETGEFICAHLQQILQREYQFVDKVHCIVTDEGSNFLKGAQDLETTEVVRERIRCACHRIQLAFRDAVEQKRRRKEKGDFTLLNLLRRCQRIVLVFKNGWASRKKDVFQRWQQLHLSELVVQIEKLKVQRNSQKRINDLEIELAKANEDVAAELAEIERKKGERQSVAEALINMYPEEEFKVEEEDSEDEQAEEDFNDSADNPPIDEKEEKKESFNEIMEATYNIDYSALEANFPAYYSHMSKCRALIAIGATRWMTYVTMARRFMMWRWSLQKSLEEIEKLKPPGEAAIDWTFTKEQLKLLEDFVTVGSVAQEVLMRLQGSLAPTISNLLYNYVVLHRNLTHWWEKGDEICQPIRNFCKEVSDNLLMKFDPDSDRTSLIAAALDPRYRQLKFLEDYPLAQKIAKDALKLEWQKLDAKKPEAEQSDVPVAKKAKTVISIDERARLAGPATAVKAEPDKWLESPNDDNCTDVLDWWKRHSPEWPLLSILARRYLAIPASSASSERLFSKLKEISSLKRNRMKADTLCKLLFVHQHVKKGSAAIE
jgi:hypothetical protein